MTVCNQNATLSSWLHATIVYRMRTDDVNYGPEYWDSLDGGTGYQDSVMHEDLAHIVKEVFGYKKGKDISGDVNILEFGCAAGYLVKHLRRRGHDAWGLDISEYAMSLAPPEAKEYLRYYDMTWPGINTQFGDNYFKLAICFETMEHIPEESVHNALERIHDTITPDGHAVFTICTEEQPNPYDDPTHVTIKPRGWWEKQFFMVGMFRNERLENMLRSFYLFSQHQGVFVCQKAN